MVVAKSVRTLTEVTHANAKKDSVWSLIAKLAKPLNNVPVAMAVANCVPSSTTPRLVFAKTLPISNSTLMEKHVTRSIVVQQSHAKVVPMFSAITFMVVSIALVSMATNDQLVVSSALTVTEHGRAGLRTQLVVQLVAGVPNIEIEPAPTQLPLVPG